MSKRSIRLCSRAIRKDISQKRRQLAVDATVRWVQETRSAGFILSYASFGSELNTKPLNEHLLDRGQLVLPKVVGDSLEFFYVTSFSHLQKNRWGIDEPDPNLSIQFSIDQLDQVFVPALAFDSRHHRLGYGKGYYDRLLSQLPKQATSIGIGFFEQATNSPLPIEPHDIPTQNLQLF